MALFCVHPGRHLEPADAHRFRNILRQCQQGAVPWQTAIDRKQKNEEVQEHVIAADAYHLHSRKRTRPSIILYQHHQRCAEQDWSMPCLFSFGAAHEPGPPRAQNSEQICVHVQNPAPKPNLMLPRRSSARSMQKPVRCFICTGWRRCGADEMFGETFITGLKKTS